MSLRIRLADGRSATGIFSKTLDSAFVEAAGLGGLDFIILDMEHGPVSLELLHHHVRAARLTGMAPIVRVRGVDAHAIGSALDAGAAGVQVPNVSTAEEAQAAVAAARFHPQGARGVCRFVRAAEYGGREKADYFAGANEALLVLQVEGVAGIANLDAILDVPGFDVLFVGPYDLSQSVGLPGQVDAPSVEAAIADIVRRATAAGKALGIFCDTPAALARYRESGIPYIAYSVDVGLFRDAVAAIVETRA
jgi:4-hydroxy-2-oxoheptanedioate aldolase